MLGPFSQSLYSTVLDEKSDNLLPFFFRHTALNLAHINRNWGMLRRSRCILVFL